MSWCRRGVLILLVLLASAGCTGSRPGATPGRSASPGGSSTSGAPPVLVPGRPGEPNRTLPPDEAPATGAGTYNDTDVWFVRAMISHHGQAIEMASLAPSRAVKAQIRSIAERIAIGQEGEIAQLRAWLSARGLDERLTHADHAAMRGMQTPAALRALAAARGGGFDTMFVTMMSAHHQGAIDMATTLLKGGKDVQVDVLATNMAAEQQAEIGRLREALKG